MLDYAKQYLQTAAAALERILATQAEAMDTAAGWAAESILAGGVLHVFGSGHSHELAEEISFRAGGLAAVNPLLDTNLTLMGGPASFSTRLERLEGYAEALLQNYDLRPGEVMLVLSQSGINPGPVEMALAAKKRGLRVAAVTSLAHSRAAASRHSSGLRLFEAADVVIDNCVPAGDACIDHGPDMPPTSPLSTVAGAAILQALVAEVAARIRAAGQVPPVWVSSNLPQGDAHNQGLIGRYPSRRLSF